MANTSLTQVFTGVTADGESAELNWPGGVGQMVVDGTFGGGTVALEMSPDDGTTWVAIGGDASVTSDAVVNFDLNGCDIRLSLSGSSGANLNGWLTRTVSDGIWGKGIMHCPNS
tara:strand:+ start:73 stop:414 length:342 start_codon:yes stop_codon:yes gene_type:complete